MGLLDGLKSVVGDAIGVVGITITIRRDATDRYDPVTGQATTLGDEYTAKSAPPAPYSKFDQAGGSVQRGDVRFLVAAKGLAIEPNPATDVIIYQGKEWKIVASDPISTGDVNAAFEVQARR